MVDSKKQYSLPPNLLPFHDVLPPHQDSLGNPENFTNFAPASPPRRSPRPPSFNPIAGTAEAIPTAPIAPPRRDDELDKILKDVNDRVKDKPSKQIYKKPAPKKAKKPEPSVTSPHNYQPYIITAVVAIVLVVLSAAAFMAFDRAGK